MRSRACGQNGLFHLQDQGDGKYLFISAVSGTCKIRKASGEVRMVHNGGTAAADLMLHLIARDHGEELAAIVADQMVYNAVREGRAAQTVSLQSRHGMRNEDLLRAIRIMQDHIEEPLAPQVIAREIGISVRQLERLFGKCLNTTPKRYSMELRLDRNSRVSGNRTVPHKELR